MNCKKIAVLAPIGEGGETGGAEKFYLALTNALCAEGVRAEQINVLCDESTFEKVQEAYQRFRELDLSGFDGVISTKAPAYVVKHPNHISYLQHTMRVFYDMFEAEYPNPTPQLIQQRRLIHETDKSALSYPNTKKLFVIGHEVKERLLKYIDVDSEVIHESLLEEKFKCGKYGDYLLMPGRLHRWKRVDLVIEAMRHVKAPIKLKIAGIGEDESRFRKLAKGDNRIEFLGKVAEEELVELYANALAIPFVPIREDFGLVTIEAFRSGKPVLTCIDSGEPAHFVRDGENGFVCSADPKSLAEKIEYFYSNPAKAKEMGLNGQASVRHLTWPNIARSLLSALEANAGSGVKTQPLIEAPTQRTNVAVIDMQPITPAIGGGRIRLLGLYHNLGESIDCHYVGTYDWPGESFRRLQLTSTLEEVVVPLSEAHHAAARSLSEEANEKNVIDVAFSQQCHLSPDYLNAARAAIRDADVVVFSHPWAFLPLADALTEKQVVVYDSHNVEGYLRAQLFDEKSPAEAKLLENVINDEYRLGCRADLILACSHEDALRFNRIYEFPFNKIRVAPNGFMAFAHTPPDPGTKRAAKTSLGLGDDSFVAIFIGSPYGPNLDAAEFIARDLSTAMPETTFVIAGGVGEKISCSNENVVITGGLDEAQKYEWFCAADIAINPMFSGSGTNIKMFDFMALALPTVTTGIGARGIDIAGQPAMLICEPDIESFVSAIAQMRDPELRQSIGQAARKCVEDSYSWERISSQTGGLLRHFHSLSNQPRPFFSVVIPSYERHDQLTMLLERLQRQVERDFEVIIVDQSQERWAGLDAAYGFPVWYYHSPVKGAIRARNTGAFFAQGEIIAFTDDDCLPDDTWLLNARRYFEDENVVGVEGAISSDHLDDPDWRPVTNIGFEGIGFMTANLLVRSAVFHGLGGFDGQFDLPHFREDTDLGWRMMQIGHVPYAADVSVFHPAQPRKNERETTSARARFFEKDPLLLAKHPEKYNELFHKEQHWKKTSGFWSNFERGAQKYEIDVTDYLQFKNQVDVVAHLNLLCDEMEKSVAEVFGSSYFHNQPSPTVQTTEI
jgi:glycosyltransferase involved in cell wall biosynthesis/GT2 family glycosyltransferase